MVHSQIDIEIKIKGENDKSNLKMKINLLKHFNRGFICLFDCVCPNTFPHPSVHQVMHSLQQI